MTWADISTVQVACLSSRSPSLRPDKCILKLNQRIRAIPPDIENSFLTKLLLGPRLIYLVAKAGEIAEAQIKTWKTVGTGLGSFDPGDKIQLSANELETGRWKAEEWSRVDSFKTS